MNNQFINQFFNQDCIKGARQHLPDNCVDFLLCDPPFGIDGGSFGSQYSRNSNLVTGGYVEVAATDYQEFSMQWIREAARVLKPGCLLCVVSGYSRLQAVLEALDHNLQFRQHLIWRFNFGVHTTHKYVSSHYHILFYEKKLVEKEEEEEGNNSLFNDDSVLMINRQNRNGQVRNQNQLPDQLVNQLINIGLRNRRSNQTSLLIADFFLGSFSTVRSAIRLGMNATGFELNSEAFQYWNLKTQQQLINNRQEQHEEEQQQQQQLLLLWPIDSIVATTFAIPTILPSPSTVTTNIDLVICWPLRLPDSNWFKSVSESMRIGASIYFVVNTRDVKLALQLLNDNDFTEVNHIIWRFVLTNNSTSNHLHILFWQKGSTATKKRTFNTYAIHAANVKRLRQSSGGGSSANYIDREDVWWQRDVEPARALLWREVVRKAIQYSSNIDDRVASFCTGCDVVRNETIALNRIYYHNE